MSDTNWAPGWQRHTPLIFSTKVRDQPCRTPFDNPLEPCLTLSLSRLNNSSSIILRRAVSVLCFLRNPDCLEYIRLSSLRKLTMSYECDARLSLTKPGEDRYGAKWQGSHSSPFLNKGVTLAIFQRDGNFPLEKDRLINLAILGATAAAEERKRRSSANLVNARRLMSIYLHNYVFNLHARYGGNWKTLFRVLSGFDKAE